MTNINYAADSLVQKLRSDEYFKDIKIIRMYPDASLSRLGENTVAIGAGDIEYEEYSIASNKKYASAAVLAYIYAVGSSKNKKAFEILEHLLDKACDFPVSTVKVYAAEYDEDAQALKLKTRLTVSCATASGGEDGE